MVLGFGKKGPSGVGCYGKLPLHGDYVSHQNDGAEARKLAAWLDEGYRLTGGHDDLEAAEISFYFPGKRAIFGSIWPSADASGTRRFPFTLFATMGGKDLAGLRSLIPLGLATTWIDMDDALAGIRAAETPDRVQSLVGAIQVSEIPEWTDLRSRFAEEAGEASDLGGATEVLVDLTRLAGALGGGKKGDVPSFAVRVPLRTGCPAILEASAWLDVLARSTNSPDLPGDCHLFLRPAKGEAGGDLYVIHRELRPEDLGFLLAPEEEYAYGNHLGEEPDEEAASELGDRLAAAAGESAPTLLDMVKLS